MRFWIHVFTFSLALHTHALELIDQKSETLRLWAVLGLRNTFGQEFVPSSSALNFVDLWFHNFGSPTPDVFQVEIRKGTIDGPLIGTSDQVIEPIETTDNIARFWFPSPILLQPRHTYVIRLVMGEGDYWGWGLGNDSSWDGVVTPYNSGRMIRDEPMEMNDLTFREGFALPTPRIPLIALTDTNNPQSAIARLTLSESRLEYILDLPNGTKDFEIVCSSNGVPLGGLIWRFVGTLPPTNQPGFPPPPPTGGGGVIIIIRPPMPGRPLPPFPPPPPLLGNQILTLNAPSAPVVIEPPRPPADPQVVTMMIPTELWPRVTNSIALSEQQMQLFRDGFGIMRFFNDTNVLVGTAFIRQTDGDEDGVPDSMDHCPSTATGSLVDTEGCSIDQLAPCDGPWRNHGEFVNAFKAVTSHFLGQGLITAKRCREWNMAAAQSDCGKFH